MKFSLCYNAPGLRLRRRRCDWNILREQPAALAAARPSPPSCLSETASGGCEGDPRARNPDLGLAASYLQSGRREERPGLRTGTPTKEGARTSTEGHVSLNSSDDLMLGIQRAGMIVQPSMLWTCI